LKHSREIHHGLICTVYTKENNWIPPTTGIIFWDVYCSLFSILLSTPLSLSLSLHPFQNPFKPREIERYGRAVEESFDGEGVGGIGGWGNKGKGKIAT
jgi:hypothetical protein